MAYSIILHIKGSDPVIGEVDELPSTSDIMVIVSNPRLLGGKDLHYLQENVVTVYYPVERLNFVEVLAGDEEEAIIGFVRE